MTFNLKDIPYTMQNDEFIVTDFDLSSIVTLLVSSNASYLNLNYLLKYYENDFINLKEIRCERGWLFSEPLELTFVPKTVRKLTCNEILTDELLDLETLHLARTGKPISTLNINPTMIENLTFDANEYYFPNFDEMVNLIQLNVRGLNENFKIPSDKLLIFSPYYGTIDLPPTIKDLVFEVRSPINNIKELQLEKLTVQITKLMSSLDISNIHVQKLTILLFPEIDTIKNFNFDFPNIQHLMINAKFQIFDDSILRFINSYSHLKVLKLLSHIDPMTITQYRDVNYEITCEVDEFELRGINAIVNNKGYYSMVGTIESDKEEIFVEDVFQNKVTINSKEVKTIHMKGCEKVCKLILEVPSLSKLILHPTVIFANASLNIESETEFEIECEKKNREVFFNGVRIIDIDQAEKEKFFKALRTGGDLIEFL